MGFKTGLVVGFGVGYVLGAKAGRGRYEQIKHWFETVSDSEMATMGKSLAETGVAAVATKVRDAGR